MGSKLTRPQARAATPLQLWETATMPIESGPGQKKKVKCKSQLSLIFFTQMEEQTELTKGSHLYLHPQHLDPVDSSSSGLGEELCQGLLSNCEETKDAKQ